MMEREEDRASDAYTLFERCNLLIGESVGLRDDRDQIDLGV